MQSATSNYQKAKTNQSENEAIAPTKENRNKSFIKEWKTELKEFFTRKKGKKSVPAKSQSSSHLAPPTVINVPKGLQWQGN